MAFTFIHAADIHLDSPLHGLQRYDGAPVDAIRQSTREALKRLVDLAIARRVNFVVIAGDLYDGDWRDYKTGLFFVAQSQRLQEAGIPLFLIAGNHDAQNLMTKSLTLPKNTTLLSADRPQTVHLDDLGVAIHGQSFATRAVFDDLSTAYPPGVRGLFNIGVLHTCGATGGEGHEPYAPCTFDGLKSRQYQYWALGHVHQRAVLLEDPVVTFAGNIQGRHIRETGPKGCWLVTVDDHQRATLNFEPLDVLRWERTAIPIDAITHEDDLWPAVSQQLSQLEHAAEGLPLAVRIVLTGTSTLHDRLHARRDHIVNQIRSVGLQAGGGRIWIEKVSLHTQPPRRTEATPSVDDGPWDELTTVIAELRSNPDDFQTVSGDIVELCQRWADIDLAALGLDAVNVEQRTALLDEVEALLWSRLAPAEDDA
ncbi:MAG: DNA repair exonuclease [Planctomycetaceae bacterium]|nr:DNA repair exonuclease [Planctomycetaceae bacterium]